VPEGWRTGLDKPLDVDRVDRQRRGRYRARAPRAGFVLRVASRPAWRTSTGRWSTASSPLHQVCPYSNATRGNIDATVHTIGG
jgi:organic hydroperoxide reductase OsmC/OhrA